MLAGWRDDLTAAWRGVLDRTELNFNSPALDCDMRPGEIILPGRKRAPAPGAPAGAHVFRAFDRVGPEDVRAVILGQDPYPNPEWATGRAFEQGGLTDWPQESAKVADSLRRIVQVLASARTGNKAYVAHDRAWGELIRDTRTGELNLEPPQRLFDRLEREGVLFLNASLTVSLVARAGSPKEPRGHYPLWEPLVNRVLSFIAGRTRGRAVFLLWGRRACDVFERSGAPSACAVRHVHPAAITPEGAAFLRPPNPFLLANESLARMGAEPISW
jgi:uracil-DNA glycosylase